SVATHRYPGDVSDFLECAVMFIAKQRVRHRIIGDEDVLPAVPVEIKGDHSQPVARFRRDPGNLADIGEGTVAVIVIQSRRLSVVVVRMAVATHPWTFISTVIISFR